MPVVECVNCGKAVKIKQSRIGKRGYNFCSRRCSAAFRSKQTEKVCPVCNRTFTALKFSQKTCSRACSNEAYRVKTVEKRRADLHKEVRSEGYAFRECPWSNGDIQPDEYGRGVYREPDFVLGF